MANFVPAFHFEDPANKIKPQWCMQAVNYYFFNGGHRSLLEGKNLNEIEDYTNGDFSMEPYKRMYKSMQKKMDAQKIPNMQPNKGRDELPIDWTPLALIPVKLNAAIAVVHKIPVEVTCTALDPLANEKRKKDISFLKSKPAFEKDMQSIADEMNIGKVDLGTTEHSSVPYSSAPYGIDLTEPDELDIFENLLYSLSVEEAYEVALQSFYELKNITQIKLLEIQDQYKYGVSVHRAFRSSLTSLPDVEHLSPDNVDVPDSNLPDFSDNQYRFVHTRVTAMELFNYFSDEIGNEEQFDNVLNGKDGYCKCNEKSIVDEKDWGTFKVNLVYCEVKSIDWIGIGEGNVLTVEGDKAKEKLWGQNTYSFWWLKNTQYIFGIDKLGYATREKGNEAYQGFSTNIYRSQKKSAVELSIGENKKAQVADIKLQHTIMKAMPPGRYIDLKFLRGALTGLKENANQWTIDDLINLALEHNTVIGDTEGFEGKNDGQLKPVIDLPGGLKGEANGYLEAIRNHKQNISDITGINDQLTGQSGDQDALVGLQKLLINASLNSLYYCNEAIREQYQNLFTIWGAEFDLAIKEGGKVREAIEALVGKRKTSLIAAIKEVPLHRMGIVVYTAQREEERQQVRESMGRLKQQGIITTADEYMINHVKNPKEAMALIAVREKQFQRREQQKAQQQFQQQQQLIGQQGQQQQQAIQAEGEQDIKKIYAKGDVESKIVELAASLGLNRDQFLALAKQKLQESRTRGQMEKQTTGLRTKADLDQQKAAGIS